MKDYTFYYIPRDYEAEVVIHYLTPDPSPHQLDLHRMIVRGFYRLNGAFYWHRQAIKDRDWDAVEFTLEQLQTHVFDFYKTAVEHANKDAKVSPQRKGGRASAQARTRDPEQTRARYYALMKRHDNDRAKVVQQLAKDFGLQPDSVRRQLRKLGLGRPQKIKD